MIWALILAALIGPAASLRAETVVTTRTIPARTVLTAQDLAMTADTVPGALSNAGQAIGLESRVSLYAGRPIRPEDLTAPALVERNGAVTLKYDAGALAIAVGGRALGRAALGEPVRAMNLASRKVVAGYVAGPNLIVVTGDAPGGAQ